MVFYLRFRKLNMIGISIFLYFDLNSTDRLQGLERLKASYPDQIQMVFENDILWTDNTFMVVGDSDPSKSFLDKLNEPSLADQLSQPSYIVGELLKNPQDDPGRIRYEPFFRKMYGNSPTEVESSLEEIVWMPRVFGENARILRVTKINNIYDKIKKISEELEELVFKYPEYVSLFR